MDGSKDAPGSSTKTSISDIVSELIDYGVIAEQGQAVSSGRGGRKPILLNIVPETAFVVGVDIRRNHISALLLDLAGDIKAKSSAVLPSGVSREDVIRTLYKCVSGVINKKKKESKMLGIGVGAPGSLDLEKGTILNLPDFKTLQNVNIEEMLLQRFEKPVFVQGGSMAGAMGEYFRRQYEGQNINNLVFIEIDLGLGFGFIFDDKLIHGPSSAGEIGHTVVEVEGPVCSCGRRGCLYQYASGLAVLKSLKLVHTEDEDNIHVINDRVNYSEILTGVIEEVKRGNPAYVETLDRAAKYLGIGIVNIFNLLSPSLLVVSSSLPGLADIYWKPLLSHVAGVATLEKNILERMSLSSYGPEAIAAGAAHMVLQVFYKDPKNMIA